jgi:DnaJ-domain-containing protein 1
MTDNFHLLDEPRRPWLDTDALKQKFRTLSAEVHPDRTHNTSESEKLRANRHYTALNAAYNCLREPKDRLRHLLELELGKKPSDLTSVPDDLMELFFEAGKSFRETDAFLAEKNQATSPMLQVQLFERGQDRVEKLGVLRQKISGRRDVLLDELKSMAVTWEKVAAKPLERLLEIWRLLSFYDRWLAQIQERVVQLSF